jgi:hypothetical protein
MVQRWVADISKDVETQLSEILKCVYHSLTVVESMDITSTAHMCIVVCGVTSDFEVFEELVGIHSMQGLTNGSDFIQALLCSLQKHNLELSKLVGIITDGAPSALKI